MKCHLILTGTIAAWIVFVSAVCGAPNPQTTLTLVYPGGAPATNATLTVNVKSLTVWQETTVAYIPDASGKVTLPVDPPPMEAMRLIVAMSPSGAAFIGDTNRSTAETITLRPFTKVRIHVVDSTGSAIPNIELCPHLSKYSEFYTSCTLALPSTWNTRTDSSGFATLSQLPQGAWLSFDVDGRKYRALSSTHLADDAVSPDFTLRVAANLCQAPRLLPLRRQWPTRRSQATHPDDSVLDLRDLRRRTQYLHDPET